MTLLNCATTGRLMISPPPMYAGGYTSTVDHAVVCKQRGFIDQRHNELRDLEAELLSSVCSDVRMGPILQDISGEHLSRGTNSAPDARLDIHARGFWERQRAALFDVRVCHPNTNSYRKMESQQVDRIRENEKNRQYSRRVLDVEQGTFTPLVLRQRVEWGKNSLSLIVDWQSSLPQTEKYNIPQPSPGQVLVSFALLRSSLVCLRGSRNIGKVQRHIKNKEIDIEVVDGSISQVFLLPIFTFLNISL